VPSLLYAFVIWWGGGGGGGGGVVRATEMRFLGIK